MPAAANIVALNTQQINANARRVYLCKFEHDPERLLAVASANMRNVSLYVYIPIKSLSKEKYSQQKRDEFIFLCNNFTHFATLSLDF